jgi:O-6-methylguanine DNA methyltransferase
MTTTVYYAQLQTPIGLVRLFASARGLVRLALPNESRSVAETYVERRLGPACVRDDEAAHAAALEQLAAYFAGARRTFDVPLDLHGTAFQRLVWDAVAAVPYGETRTYRDVARAIDRPAAVRAAGAANGANPVPLIVPCHRIVGTNGSLTGYGGGIEVKRHLLALERGERAG